MTSLELALVSLKFFTVAIAGALVGLSARSYRRSGARSMQVLMVGLAAICLGTGSAFFGAIAFGPTGILWVFESVFLLVGIGLLLIAIWVE